MRQHPFTYRLGSERLYDPVNGVWFLLVCTGIAYLAAQMGIMISAVMIVLPFVALYLVLVFQEPKLALYSTLIIAFFATGISRYVPAPLGLAVDGLLVLGWVALLFRQFQYTDWKPMRHDFNVVHLIWMIWLVIEIFNPETQSKTAWFYAMRSMGLYPLLSCGLVMMLMRDRKDLRRFIHIIFIISILGALWGLKQKNIGLDDAEKRWLFVGGNADTHILFGVLRVFSFYSDAGQFGASQAMVALMAGIMMLGPGPLIRRGFYGFTAMMTFIGFGISGTRGALAVLAAGGIAYLVMTKRISILLVGLFFAGSSFYMLRYTSIMQGNAQVRRMRTGVDPENPSMMVRKRNQIKFAAYLKNRPMGGGVGSAGFWGNRFSPGTFLAETATDSWYVKIWAETGIIGLLIHVCCLGYFVGRAGHTIWHVRDPVLHTQLNALFSGMVGILLASFGNQVLAQFPTGIIVYFSVPFFSLAPMFEELYAQEVKPTNKLPN